MKTIIVIASLALTSIAHAAQVADKVPYEVDGVKLEGVLIHDPAAGAKPGLVLVPNWLGINDANLAQAKMIAARGYTVFVADTFGVAGRPKSMDEAGKMSGALKSDRPLLRKRVAKALDVLVAAKTPGLDAKRIAAIGFCFGGTAVLELARSGAKLGAVVSFHGGLDTPKPADAKNIKGKVLALHGADDPFVPAADVQAFQEEMRAAKVDWQLVAYGNAVHSFTDVDANMAGKAQYNAAVAKRAYAAMDAFLAEALPR
jgi:dienelactone hydrolase